MSFVWNPFAVPPLACFLLAAAISLLIVASRRVPGARREPGPTYAPVAFAAGVWSLGIALLACCHDREVALLIGRFSATVVLVIGAFAMRYVSWFARSPHRRSWMIVSVSVTALGIALVWLDPGVMSRVRLAPWGGLYPLLGPHGWTFFVLSCLGVAGPGLMAARLWWTSPPSRRRRQAGYIALGYVVTLAGAIDMVGVTGGDMPPLAWITTTASIIVFYYASVRWRLVDTRTALHKTLIVTLVTLATFAPSYALALVTQDWAGWRQPVPRAFAVGFAMGLLLLWIARVEPFVVALFRRRAARNTAMVSQFATESAGERRPESLMPLVDRALAAIAGLRLHAVVLDVDLGGQRLELRLPEGTRAPLVALELAAPLEPVARGEIDLDAAGAASAPAAQILDAWQADAVLPLRHQGNVVGILLARGGSPGKSFDEVTREGLVQLGDRVAVAFINAALEQALERRSQDLEQEVADRTRALALAVEDLKYAQAQLVQAERQSSLGVLVAGVSHEINNALNFISGNLPMMERYADDFAELYARGEAAGARPRGEAIRRAREARSTLPGLLAAMQGAAERARCIVGDLRRFARRDDDERRLLDVRDGLESTLNLLGPELVGRIEVERRFAAALPTVSGWPSALNHVFLNVLLNAAQSIAGPGRIVVAAENVPVAANDDPARVVVTISDSGAGVPAIDAERVFQAFFTTRARAAGLGLAVSRQIVDRHGGTIGVTDDPELGGAKVTILLPIVAQ